MTGAPERPSFFLTRLFFGRLFDLGFLSDTGALSFTRLILGICGVILSFWLPLVRLYAAKYARLSEQPGPDLYRLALPADYALLIALPMWIVAFVTTLVGHALFPDEIDFRILMAQPVSRRRIFGAKLLAVTLFAGIFVAAVQVTLVPLFLMMGASRWAEGALLPRAGAYVAASLFGAACAGLAVVALHGALLLGVGAIRAMAASAAVRSVLVLALVLALPLVAQLPGQARAFAEGRPWLQAVPAAWFVGLEQYLLGDRREHVVRLASLAAAVTAAVSLVAAGSYAVLYRRFDRLMLRPATSLTPARARRTGRLSRSIRGRSVAFSAMRAFILTTLRRSALHQGVIVLLTALGAGLVANSFILSGVLAAIARSGPLPSRVVESLIWAPFVLMFVAARAVRLSLLLPIDQRANWVFRITESADSRVDQLDATVQAVRLLGVIVPVVLLFPFQAIGLGGAATTLVPIEIGCGWLYVELLMKGWTRLPFTCSYIPGKRFVPQMVVIGFFSFLYFTTWGADLARAGLGAPGRLGALAGAGLLFVASAGLHWHRRSTARSTALEFEDVLPTDINPLRLSAD